MMNRAEFMRQLEALLQGISPTEREEALQYYNDYFNDAGAENEQDVIAALGTPARVAENIKRDLSGSGYGDNPEERKPTGRHDMVEYQGTRAREIKEEKKMSTGMIVLIVILAVLASPILLGIGSGVVGILTGIVAAWFGLIIGFGVASILLFVILVVLIAAAVMTIMAGDIIVGMGLIGGGLLCGGIGILFLMLTVAMAGIATPAIFRGIASLCRGLFGGKQTA